MNDHDTRTAIEPPQEDLDLESLRKIACDVASRRELWERGLPRSDEERGFVEVHTSEHLGVWAISWRADDHDTGFHDHDRSRSAVAVADDAIRHELLWLESPADGAMVPAGDFFTFDETVIHRMRYEPSSGTTVTIHAYSPPLEWTGQYTTEDNGGSPLRRIPTSSDQQLKPK